MRSSFQDSDTLSRLAMHHLNTCSFHVFAQVDFEAPKDYKEPERVFRQPAAQPAAAAAAAGASTGAGSSKGADAGKAGRYCTRLLLLARSRVCVVCDAKHSAVKAITIMAQVWVLAVDVLDPHMAQA
jgi:hypothetical protein